MTGDQCLAVYQEIVTVGFRPRTRSKKVRSVFCVGCGSSLGLGPIPEGQFNINVWDMLKDILTKNPSILAAAQFHLENPSAQLRPMPGSVSDKSLTTSVLKIPALSEAS
jgi:hypothetical protein